MDGINFNNINLVDLSIIFVVSLSAIFGILRGFVREAISLVTWITALFVATFYCTTVADHLTVISMAGLRYLIAFLLLVLVVLIIGGLINHWISQIISLTGFSVTDRITGAIFGIARGVLIVAIVIMIVGRSSLVQQPLWIHSSLIPQLQPIADWIRNSIPEDLINKITLDQKPTQKPATPPSAPAHAAPAAPAVLPMTPSPQKH